MPPLPDQIQQRPGHPLYFGDCLTIMRDKMRLNSVDLVYLDPPFNSNREYNAIYKDETGRPLPDQIEAFCDLWTLDEDRERSIRAMPILMRDTGIEDEIVKFWQLWTNALRNTQPRLLAYLSYMVERLIIMKGLIKPTGSIYLHCDPTASHYIKVMMDAIFGHRNFKNQIIWKRTSGHSDSGTLGSVHDTILMATKSDRFTHNTQYRDYDEAYISRRYRRADADGRKWMDDNLTAKGLRGGGYEYEYKGAHSIWRVPEETMQKLDSDGRLYFTKRGGIRIKRYLEEMKGVPLTDVWTDINPINSQSKERLGYATQKPVALLERIVKMSSNKGDVVFDPFCGCATTLEAAHRLGRKWIGIDLAIHAIKRVAKVRLKDRLGLVEGTDFVVDGVPRNLEGARDIWERDKYHFQRWAIEQVDGFVTTKRTADGGVDGRLYFGIPGQRDLQSMAIEVKGGKNVSIRDLRALRGVMDNGAALIAGLIIMYDLGSTKTRNFHKFMAEAGDLEVTGVQYPRMQMLTVEEILEGKQFSTPSVAGRGLPQPVLPGTQAHSL